MPLPDLVRPSRSTLRGDVHAQLRDMLMAGRVMPGQTVPLRALAEALGVSVMPVREAVNLLVAERALEAAPSRAVRVPIVSPNQFAEITDIRVVVEGVATRAAARNLDAAGLAEIARHCRMFDAESAATEPDPGRLIAINKDLHFAIYSAAAMPELLWIIEGLWLRIGPILNYDLRSRSPGLGIRTALNHHAQLLRGLECRDPDASAIAIGEDIRDAAAIILREGHLLTSPQPALHRTRPK